MCAELQLQGRRSIREAGGPLYRFRSIVVTVPCCSRTGEPGRGSEHRSGSVYFGTEGTDPFHDLLPARLCARDPGRTRSKLGGAAQIPCTADLRGPAFSVICFLRRENSEGTGAG